MDEQFLKDFESFRADVKARCEIEITLEQYKQMRAEERKAKEIQEEAKKLDLAGSASSCEESNAKCSACSSGLSTIEIMLYGNRCVFCKVGICNIGLIEFLRLCYYDWRIYQELLNRMNKDEARHDLLGCLGVLGYFDINQVKTIKAKRDLLKELREFGK